MGFTPLVLCHTITVLLFPPGKCIVRKCGEWVLYTLCCVQYKYSCLMGEYYIHTVCSVNAVPGDIGPFIGATCIKRHIFAWKYILLEIIASSQNTMETLVNCL